MTQFIISYIGGEQPATPEDGQRHFQKYKEWLGSLGAAAVSPANPMKGTVTVLPDGSVSDSGVSSMTGFTIVEVDSIDAAIGIAKACPFLDIGGSLEVSELIAMSM